MHLGTVVVRARGLVFSEEEHACERRDAKLADVLAQVHLGLHVDDRIDTRLEHEAIGARRTPRIEQRVESELTRAWRRPLDPEFDEAGKFLPGGERRVDRESSRGQSVELILAQGTEIARPQEDQHFVLVLRRIDRVVHAKAREADGAEALAVDLVGAVVKLVRS